MPSTRAVASQIVGEYFHGSTFDLHFIPAEFDEAVGQQQEGQEGQQGNQQGTGMPENGNQQEQQVEQNQRKEIQPEEHHHRVVRRVQVKGQVGRQQRHGSDKGQQCEDKAPKGPFPLL